MLRTAMSRTLEIISNAILSLLGIVSIGWVVWRALKRSDEPGKALFKALFSIALIVGDVLFIHSLTPHLSGGESPGDYGVAFMIAGSIAAVGITLSILWTEQISDLLISPLTSQLDGGQQEMERKPYYSVAISKRKMNRPLEAIVAIREQLAKFPKDFEGVTLLANIQAEDMKDLQSAEITFDHFCNSPDAPDRQVAAAWTQVADWHLKIAQDADSARASLEKIRARFPGTLLAAQAAQRIAHLGGAEKILLAAHDRQAMVVPEGVNNIGLLDSTEFLQPTEDDPAQLAADFVKHLAQHPQDTDAREKLAVIYAQHYQRLDLATMELNQLIEEPDHPAKRVAHWLNLLANLQVKGGADCDTVRATLEKIVECFPGLPVAEIAQSRLSRLKLEFKGKEETPGKKLGVYEQNIGLKYGSPYRSPREL
jgi:tetratricopeptide (TPR) repeat protein